MSNSNKNNNDNCYCHFRRRHRTYSVPTFSNTVSKTPGATEWQLGRQSLRKVTKCSKRHKQHTDKTSHPHLLRKANHTTVQRRSIP
jgi:hypothetical protein